MTGWQIDVKGRELLGKIREVLDSYQDVSIPEFEGLLDFIALEVMTRGDELKLTKGVQLDRGYSEYKTEDDFRFINLSQLVLAILLRIRLLNEDIPLETDRVREDLKNLYAEWKRRSDRGFSASDAPIELNGRFGKEDIRLVEAYRQFIYGKEEKGKE